MLEECLAKILDDPNLHASWLNTFSYLEYVGFRKIVKSQDSESMSLETLGHAVEEGRHALRLKRLAVKVGGQAFDSYRTEKLLCGGAAEAYFQKLDGYCESLFADLSPSEKARLTYLYVTLLVELRALDVYGLYQKSMKARQLPFPLEGLLKEEEGHLRAVESELRIKDPQFLLRFSEIKKVEEKLYQDFVRALANCLLSNEVGLHA
jgi:hypothetical protein